MNVSLTSELEEFVRQKVAGGMYHSVSEVIRDGLRLLAERDRIRELRIEELRKEIQIGLEQLDRGEGVPAAQAIAAYDELADKAELVESLALIDRSTSDIQRGAVQQATPALKKLAESLGLKLDR